MMLRFKDLNMTYQAYTWQPFLIVGLLLMTRYVPAVETGGQIHFGGSVVNAGCAVDARSTDQTINMGQVRKDAFNGVGSWADPIGFTLTITDCDSTVSQSAGVAFQGVTDSHDPMVLAVIDGPGSAIGVGLGIYDEQTNLVVPNSAPRSYKTLIDGENVLHFLAKYRATARIVAGNASVVANFIVIYP